MLRAFTGLSLVILILSSAFLKSAIFFDFKIHQQEIKETLCVQRNELKNTCNGKCHLSKQLEQAESDTEDEPATRTNVIELLLYFSSNELTVFVPNEEITEMHATHRELLGIGLIHSIFHPPQIV